MENSGNLILLFVGLLSSRCAASIVDKILELDGHRSAIYLSQKDGSEDGVMHIFEKINEHIGAYALLHYNYNYTFAYSVRKVLENAIRSKVNENGVQANIDWKSFLKIEWEKEDKMGLTISIVIADGGTAAIFESIPKATIDEEVAIRNSNKRFILMKTGFELDQNVEASAKKKLEYVAIWRAAAKMIVDLANITEHNRNKAKGTIIIDLDRVHRGFNHAELLSTSGCCTVKEDLDRVHPDVNGTAVLPTPTDFTPIEKTLALNGHRVAIYLLQKNEPNGESNKNVVYLFEKITDKIGVYGFLHYRCNYNVAVAAKGLLEKDVRSNIDGNGEAKVRWKFYLKKTIPEIETMVKLMLPKNQRKSELAVEVIVVDKDTAIEVKWFPKTPSKPNNSSNMKLTNFFRGLISDNVDKGVTVYSPNDDRHIFMRTDFGMHIDEVKRGLSMYGKIEDWKKAPREIINCCIKIHKKVEKSIGSIVIELGPEGEKLDAEANESC